MSSLVQFFLSDRPVSGIFTTKYPLLHEDGRGTIQMMTVMDMNSNTLVADEIVLQDHAYRLEQFGEDFYLPPQSKVFNYDLKIKTF